jgi:hypothetical protein
MVYKMDSLFRLWHDIILSDPFYRGEYISQIRALTHVKDGDLGGAERNQSHFQTDKCITPYQIFRFPPSHIYIGTSFALPADAARLFSPSSQHAGEFNSTNHSTSLTIILFRGLSWHARYMQMALRKLNPHLTAFLVSARRGGRTAAGNRVLDERRARVRRHRQPQLGDGRRGRLRRHLAPQTDQDGEWRRKS